MRQRRAALDGDDRPDVSQEEGLWKIMYRVKNQLLKEGAVLSAVISKLSKTRLYMQQSRVPKRRY